MLKYLVLLRIINVAIVFISVIIGAFLVHISPAGINIILLAAFSASLTAAAGNIINDYYDITTDEINKPFRPLPSGEISPRKALAIFYVLNFISLASAAFISFTALGIVIAAQLLLFLYSWRLKSIPLLGNFVIALLTGLVFIYGADAAGNIKAGIIPAVFAFLINLIRELLKDIEDMKGDSASGIKTFPGTWGIDNTRHIIFAITFVLILFTFHPFIYRYYSIEFFIIAMAVVNPLLVYILKSLYRDDTGRNLSRLSLLLKINMLFGLIAIYAGR